MSYADDHYDRERDRELEDRSVESAKEWNEAEKFDRMFRTEVNGPGEEE